MSELLKTAPCQNQHTTSDDLEHSMRGRWLTGWTLTGALAAPVMNHALNAEVYGLGRALSILLFVLGGTGAVVAGAWLSATLRGRNPRADALIAGGAYVFAALVFLALVFGQPMGSPQDFPQFLIYSIGCLALFGSLFGVGTGRYYRMGGPLLLLALGSAGAALLAALLIFVFGYLLAGGNLLVVYGIVTMEWKVPVGLVLSGFLGALLPGIIVESLLPQS